MNTFINFVIKSEYKRIDELGDKLGELRICIHIFGLQKIGK